MGLEWLDWTLPVNLSVHRGGIDEMYYLILAITGLAFVLVEAGILWFVFRYRSREGHQARYTHGNDRLELIWTAIPAIVVVMLGIRSGGLWADIKAPDAYPEDALTVDVRAQQFEWHFEYRGADGEAGTEDDFSVRNHLHLPADRPVVVHLESEDVIHSFSVPELRVKQDAVPGMTTTTWFEASEPAQVELGCAELCGLGHYRMKADVTVHSEAAFEEWRDERSAEAESEG